MDMTILLIEGTDLTIRLHTHGYELCQEGTVRLRVRNSNAGYQMLYIGEDFQRLLTSRDEAWRLVMALAEMLSNEEGYPNAEPGLDRDRGRAAG
jgi:hypothetical protein